MTTITSAQNGGGIAFKVPANNGDVHLLYQCGIDPRTVAQKGDPGFVALSGFVSSLRCVATIDSLPEADLPKFEVEDSESQRHIKSLDVQWKSPRRQIDLLWSLNGIDWERISSVPLLNPRGYPFTTQNLLELYTDDDYLEIPDTGAIGIRVFEVEGEYIDENGATVIYSGFLADQDEVAIWGSWIEEISFKETAAASGGTGGGVIEQAGLLRGSIIETSGAGGLLPRGYEVGTPAGQPGTVTVGYYVLANRLRIFAYGGGATNPTAKRLQILDAWENDRILFEVDAGVLLNDQDRNTRAWSAIDTSAHAGKTALIKIVNEDSDPDWGLLAIDPIYVFSEE